MSDQADVRLHTLHALQRAGTNDLGRYAELLASTPSDRVIKNLSPWAFLPTPGRSQSYCSEAIGRPVLPFAQAIGEDMMACFEVGASTAPAVVVIDPWVKSHANVVLAELPDFEAWLVYAKKIAQEVQARKQADGEDD